MICLLVSAHVANYHVKYWQSLNLTTTKIDFYIFLFADQLFKVMQYNTKALQIHIVLFQKVVGGFLSFSSTICSHFETFKTNCIV